MKLSRIFILFYVLVFSASVLAAENDLENNVQISGKGYLEWSKQIEKSTPGENENTFKINRFYFTLKKKIDDVWSVKFTTDVGRVDDNNGDKTEPYAVYLKYGYVQALSNIGNSVGFKFKFGLIDTPTIGFINKKSDYRWIYSNYIGKAKDLIGTSIDYSADLGAKLDLKIFKVATISAGVFNGEGYKQVSESDDGKAYQGMININPINGVDLFANYRYEITNDADSSNNYIQYSLFGISYSVDMIKIGMVYAMPETKSNGTLTKYSLVDSWIHLNLNKIINAPVLIMGRYAFGENKDVSYTKVTVIAGGVGYKFNKSLRVSTYYENIDDESKSNSDKTFYIKTEVKF